MVAVILSAPCAALSARRRWKFCTSACGSFLSVCAIDGCTKRSVTPGTISLVPCASRRRHGDEQQRRRHRAPAAAAEIAEPRGKRRRGHGDEAQAIDAGNRNELENIEATGKSAGPGVAHKIPRETRKNVPRRYSAA